MHISLGETPSTAQLAAYRVRVAGVLQYLEASLGQFVCTRAERHGGRFSAKFALRDGDRFATVIEVSFMGDSQGFPQLVRLNVFHREAMVAVLPAQHYQVPMDGPGAGNADARFADFKLPVEPATLADLTLRLFGLSTAKHIFG